MSASKQKNSRSKQTKKDSQQNSASKIQNFFKSAPRTFVVEDIHNNNGCSSQSVYIEALKKKLRDINAGSVIQTKTISYENHSSDTIDASAVDEYVERHASEDGAHALPQSGSACTAEKHEEPSGECSRAECMSKAAECREWERKYKELKKAYLNITVNYAEENIKYKNLVKLTVRTTDDTEGVPVSDDGIFTPNEMKALGRIAPGRPQDSTFILESLQYAYKSDLSVLLHRTLMGTSDHVEIADDGQQIHHVGKEPLTPKKVERIKELFVDRLSNCEIDSASHGERIKETNINRLFASGIKNINKKLKEKASKALKEN